MTSLSANSPSKDLNFTMKLVSIEVHNFKSFSGQASAAEDGSHIIGPFTRFTGIIGPNGVGKSNIFDAIAFALNLQLAPGKARHARELAHIPKPLVSQIGSDQPDPEQEFWVKLNLLKVFSGEQKTEKMSLQRGLKKREAQDGTSSFYNEYIVNEDEERPLLFEEYKQLLHAVLGLDV